MKKKTIKFYFFKKNMQAPAISYLFCFTKKFVKHKKKLVRFSKKPSKGFFENAKLVESFVSNKKLRKKITFNQWRFTYINEKSYFCRSFFVFNKIKSLRAFRLWFFLKKKSKKKNLKKILTFNMTGLISSHFIHFLINKNLLYQNKSKYNSQIFDDIKMQAYLNIYTKILYSYVNILNFELYEFTKLINKQYTHIDDNFSLKKSDWVYINFTSRINFFTPIYSTIKHTKNVHVNLSHILECNSSSEENLRVGVYFYLNVYLCLYMFN